jgi:hypothetical protein
MPSIQTQFLHPIGEPFESDYTKDALLGVETLRKSRVAMVGLARNCGQQLEVNIENAVELLDGVAADWRIHLESNDCTDNTRDVLFAAQQKDRRVTFHYGDYGRPHLPAEFAGPRTIAIAEYRTKCQEWVREYECDYVIVVDWDQWGSWSATGLLNGLGWLLKTPSAFGMASVSLFQYDFGNGPQWAHYDCWALRGVGQRSCYWDTYRNGVGGFAYSWFPPVGSEPVLVSSAFGGMAIYRAGDYLAGTYNGETDCEHVTFHQSIAEKTGRDLYICPSMRCIMSWLPDPKEGSKATGDAPAED